MHNKFLYWQMLSGSPTLGVHIHVHTQAAGLVLGHATAGQACWPKPVISSSGNIPTGSGKSQNVRLLTQRHSLTGSRQHHQQLLLLQRY
jgi:hypothetical protein